MRKPAKKHTFRRILRIALISILLLCAVIVGMCLFNERPAVRAIDETAAAFPNAEITVSDDGSVEILPAAGIPVREPGVIFYVGAQITPDAYIPLLARLSEAGYPCYIPKLTFNMAALSPKAAEAVMQAHPETTRWILAGHSMGGLTSSGFACNHPDEVDGLVLIAAYTNRDMKETDLPTLAVFGDHDGVMNRDLYEKRRSWNSADFEERIIPGANHAQYGDYGEQPRDSAAAISAEEQQAATAEILLDWLERHALDGR